MNTGWIYVIISNPIPVPGRPAIMERNGGMENILSYWILIAFCLKGIWRLSSQSFNGRRQMLLVVLTVLMIRLPIYRKQ